VTQSRFSKFANNLAEIVEEKAIVV